MKTSLMKSVRGAAWTGVSANSRGKTVSTAFMVRRILCVWRVAGLCLILALGLNPLARAEIRMNVSVKLILDGNGDHPSGGEFDTPEAIRTAMSENNRILAGTGRGYVLDVEVIELHNAAEWFDKPARNGQNRVELEVAARLDPARFVFRADAINLYINNTSAGICASPPLGGDVILMATHTSTQTPLHEIGHYFGLCHTQGCDCNRCDEDPPFSDCKSPKSDGIDDTLSDLACFDQDQIAIFNFFPPLPYAGLSPEKKRQVDDVFHNVMSYHNGKDRLTPGQMDRLADIANSDRRYVSSGRTWFVDSATPCQVHDGSSNCSFDPFNLGGPFRTVGEAVGRAEGGDIVLVRGGVYPDAITIRKAVELRASRGAAILGLR